MRECSVLGWGRGDNEIYSKRKLVCDFPVTQAPKFFRAISGSYSGSKSRDLEGAEEKAVPRFKCIISIVLCFYDGSYLA